MAKYRDVVVAFPALRFSDRDAFREAISRLNNSGSSEIIFTLYFIYLDLSESTSSRQVVEREAGRHQPVMRADQVVSQYDILQKPGSPESNDTIVMDGELSAQRLQKMAKHCIKLVKRGRSLEYAVDKWELQHPAERVQGTRRAICTIPAVCGRGVVAPMPVVSEYGDYGSVFSMPVYTKEGRRASSSSIDTVYPAPVIGNMVGGLPLRHNTAPAQWRSRSWRVGPTLDNLAMFEFEKLGYMDGYEDGDNDGEV
jgi:gluconate kinase